MAKKIRPRHARLQVGKVHVNGIWASIDLILKAIAEEDDEAARAVERHMMLTFLEALATLPIPKAEAARLMMLKNIRTLSKLVLGPQRKRKSN